MMQRDATIDTDHQPSLTRPAPDQRGAQPPDLFAAARSGDGDVAEPASDHFGLEAVLIGVVMAASYLHAAVAVCAHLFG